MDSIFLTYTERLYQYFQGPIPFGSPWIILNILLVYQSIKVLNQMQPQGILDEQNGGTFVEIAWCGNIHFQQQEK